MRIATSRAGGRFGGHGAARLPSTLGVTMEMMILHGRAVVRGTQKAMPVIDMPFGSYEESPEQAYRNAVRLMAETGAPAVKLEGGRVMAPTIAFLTARGVPVMAHVGLTPQSVNTLGGYKVWVAGRGGRGHGRRAVGAGRGRLFGRAGKVPVGLPAKSPSTCHPHHRHRRGTRLRRSGAGRGRHAGHVHRLPAQVRETYADLGAAADAAIAQYAAEVRARTFPGPEHGFADELPPKGQALIVGSVADLRLHVAAWKAAGHSVGVVPTMGALHDGHLSLVRAAKADCGRVIVTIFVNPTQFNNPADLEKYPRTEDADAALLATWAWTRSTRPLRPRYTPTASPPQSPSPASRPR